VIRTLVADDHSLIREGTRQIIEREPDLEVVGEAGTGEDALALMTELAPDIALLDLRLPDISGIEVTRRAQDLGLSTRCVLLSAFDEEEYVMEALAAGASGYLSKTAPSQELASWLRRAHAGEVALDPQLAARLARFMGRASTRGEAPTFSARELAVLQLLATGLANKQIARQLGISPRTVEGHLSHIFGKLGVTSRTAAVLYAVNHGLVGPSRSPTPVHSSG
jgi:DNA-binding NarL/FixJ family response regulator